MDFKVIDKTYIFEENQYYSKLKILFKQVYGISRNRTLIVTDSLEECKVFDEYRGGIPMQFKVLLVDDASFIRTLLRRIVEENGHEVVGEACNGLEALVKHRELNPDLIFMDITMPEMDGISTIKEIRLTDDKVKIVVCSAMSQKRMVLEAVKSGADDFIEKPFKEEKIIEVLVSFE